MKINDYSKLENYIQVAKKQLEMAYEEIDTSEDLSWTIEFEKAITKIEGLYQEMIFTFTIED